MGPLTEYGNLTIVVGCLSRSVRDTARWFDVANGHHPTDPLSLPRVEGWEAGLGTHVDELRGLRVAVVADWGDAVVSPVMWDLLEGAAEQLIADARLAAGRRRRRPPAAHGPGLGAERRHRAAGRARRPVAGVRRRPDPGDPRRRWSRPPARTTPPPGRRSNRGAWRSTRRWPGSSTPSTASTSCITASNPDIAFPADGPLPHTFGGVKAGRGNNGKLTFPANLHGNPAVSIPAGAVDGLPIGLQVVGRHFTEPLLLDIALTVERRRPWPLVAPSAPC